MKDVKLTAQVVDNDVIVVLECNTAEALALITAALRVVADRACIDTDTVIACLADTIKGQEVTLKKPTLQ